MRRPPTEVRWTSPQTYQDNPNANALHWGTLYSFWFTCDHATVAGHADLDLFKPAVGCQPVKANIAISVPAPDCSNDIVRSGTVDVDDLLAVISAWGPCACQYTCPADVSVNGQVDVDDLLSVIRGWGACR